MILSQHTSVKVMGSGRDDPEPFMGLRIESNGEAQTSVLVTFALDKVDRLIEELEHEKQRIIEFEAARPKMRAA